MRHLKPLASPGYLCLFSILLFGLAACTFPSAMRNLAKGDTEKARKKFIKSKDHRVYGTGAEFMLGRLGLESDTTIENWIRTNEDFCELETRSNQLPIRTIFKLKRYDVAAGNIRQARDVLQVNTQDRLYSGATVQQLLLLEDNSSCWSETALDSVRRVIVNKNIVGRQAVYDPPLKQVWSDPTLYFPYETRVLIDSGYSCRSLLGRNPWGISYDELERIQEHYQENVLPVNYGAWWNLQEQSWDILQLHQSFCHMEEFAANFPEHEIVQDCWYEDARDVLCSRDLEGLLNFHREHAHTGLDWELCEMAACLWAQDPSAIFWLSEERQSQLQDIMLMLDLRNALLSTCSPELDSTELINTVADLARRYPYHRAPWVIGTATLNYFACEHRYDWARRALDTLQPLYPDSVVCDYSFVFQTGKQQWLNNYRRMLDRFDNEDLPGRIPERVTAWNTSKYDEYSLVSYGNTKEVFFMRSEIGGGPASVMRSEYKDGEWTTPKSVKELYLSNDMELLSIGKKGRKMLLRSKGQLWQSYREEIGRKWYEPRALSLGGRVAEYGWLSDDDSLLYLAVYEHRPDASWRPYTDLAVAKLSTGEQYRMAVPLSEEVNIPDFTEQRPVAALGGRMLFFTSDRLGGVGYTDMYRVNYRRPGDWSSTEDVMNLGLTINTVDDDSGITYFSEYGGNAFYHSAGCCGDDLDIWQVNLGAELFPDALRLAGLVLDENGAPLSGGFMEFTPNFQLNVHAMSIAKDGTYVYTVPDSTAVVRLFPEIPGYYSEFDRTHHLAETERGEIIRDTFLLLSFEHIRQTFSLDCSTFFEGTAEFDQPECAYPEITRLSKIANRMGAELDLVGHTDDFGTAEQNMILSSKRAEAVKQFLVDKCGFDPERIHTDGRGSTEPIASNNTEEGRRQNRRIAIRFIMPELTQEEQEVTGNTVPADTTEGSDR